METLMPPTEGQIKQTIQDLQKRLADPLINQKINRPVKEGYSESVNVLAEHRTTYDGIDQLTTLQGRAIAVLAVDYLKGECSKEVLMGVKLKQPNR